MKESGGETMQRGGDSERKRKIEELRERDGERGTERRMENGEKR